MSQEDAFSALVLGRGAARRDSVSHFWPDLRGYGAHLSCWRKADLKVAVDSS